MDFSEFRFVRKHKAECDKCGWHRWSLVKQKNKGGTWQFRYICAGCERPAIKYVKKSDVVAAGLDPDEIPSYGERNACVVCGHDGAQCHHWAPLALFGEDSENWPTSYLCQKCHTRWHQVVTPNINKTKA